MNNKINQFIKKTVYKKNTEEYILSNSLKSNVAMMKKVFSDEDTLIVRYFENQKNSNFKFCTIFFKK